MTNSLLFFDPVFPLWVIIVLVAALSLFFIWKEIGRKQRFLALRLTAHALMAIALLGVLLRPGLVTEKRSSGIALLTPNYAAAQVDSLLQVYTDLRLIHTSGTAPYRKSELLKSYYDLRDISHEIHFVVGEGVPDYALDIFEIKKFRFLPTNQSAGITQVHVPSKIEVNQPVFVHGQAKANESSTITLLGPGGKEDSIRLKGNAIQEFTLKFKPKKTGLFVYTIQYKDQSGIKAEQLPIEVREETKLNILLLQKFPSFEVRQLKNFLIEKGHQLALRYQVSKNNYRFEFANMASLRLSPIASTTLQQFDLVITDSEALELLSASEKNALENEIRNGLGILIIPHQASEKDKVRERFLPIEMKRSLKDTTQLTFRSKQYLLPVVALQINEEPGLYTISKNKNRAFSAYTYVGFGKSGIQLLQETYRIALEGNVDDYASLWSPLVEKIARSKTQKFKINVTTSFPFYPDEPLKLEVISTVDEFPELFNDEIKMPLTEDVAIDNLWIGKTWAGEPGWHTLSADSSFCNYFVSKPGAWKSLRIANQLKNNGIQAHTGLGESSAKILDQREKIPVALFFFIFLIASGFLWLAPKL